MVAAIFSGFLEGVEGRVVKLEASRQRSLPKVQIIGLPGDIVRESSDRVVGCLNAMGFDVPTSRILIHLSPASSRKQGSQFDLAIALALLSAEGLLGVPLPERLAALGELNLNGSLAPIVGGVSLISSLASDERVERVILPLANEGEAQIAGKGKAVLARDLRDVIESIRQGQPLASPKPSGKSLVVDTAPELIDRVRGQTLAKRALQVAMAGRHHLLMVGEPGVGKSLLANMAVHLASPLSDEELLEVHKTHAHLWRGRVPAQVVRPFRSPHHSISSASMLGGGGSVVVPGEVTLAHYGILFLDEFTEFHRDVLEGLREPLESRRVHLHRIGFTLSLPASFQLIAAMNPCPCGYALSLHRQCSCSHERLLSYRKKVSGPILDRMDLCVLMRSPTRGTVSDEQPREERKLNGSELARGVELAWKHQHARFNGQLHRYNSEVPLPESHPDFGVPEESRDWLAELESKGMVSQRGMAKLVRVARTIADLGSSSQIDMAHLQEAWLLRTPENFHHGRLG